MKYLITGGAGFVGSHLVDRLLAEGHQVLVLDDFSTGSKNNLAHHLSNSNLQLTEGSILDSRIVDSMVRQSDRIFHLAAAVGVFNIVKDPLESLKTNIHGSSNLFESSLKHKKPILITSSSEIYGKNSANSLSEDDDRIIGAPQKTRWSYSDSKAIDEAMAISIHRKYGLETKIVRLFNTVGPRQVGHYGMVVPRFVSAALKNLPLEVYGTGRQTRCFGHVLDVVDAICRVDKCKELIAKPVNIGVSDEISILDLAKRIISRTNSHSSIEFKQYSEVYDDGFEDMERRVPNTQLLTKNTGWNPQRNIDDIIDDIAAEVSTS